MSLHQKFTLTSQPMPRSSAASEEELDFALARLFAGEDLTSGEAKLLFGRLVDGELEAPIMSAMLVALRLKGETSEELIGAARALRAADRPFPRPDTPFADSCGTGGDHSGSINVSTAVALVAAAAGLPMVKHGNRSITSRCGSADVLERLGVRLDPDPETSRRTLDEVGICFLLAPDYHPGLRHAGPVRRALKVRTIMNLLGPCLNPAEPPIQLLGVADPDRLEPIALTLQALGVAEALVVHGSGLDEIALHGPTDAVRLSRGRIERLTLTPEQAGLSRAPLEQIRGGDPEANAESLLALLQGRGGEAERMIVSLNAGALLMIAGKAGDLTEGTALAADTLASGRGHALLRRFAEASHG